MADTKKDVDELTAQLDFMRSKLSETRAILDKTPLVIAYDNGGGQVGVRENPAYTSYEKLMRTYCSTLRELRELVGKKAAKQPELVKFQKFADSMKKVSSD